MQSIAAFNALTTITSQKVSQESKPSGAGISIGSAKRKFVINYFSLKKYSIVFWAL